jgi:hypothetical protein
VEAVDEMVVKTVVVVVKVAPDEVVTKTLVLGTRGDVVKRSSPTAHPSVAFSI